MKKTQQSQHVNSRFKQALAVLVTIIIALSMISAFSLGEVYAAKKVDSKTKSAKEKEAVKEIITPSIQTGSAIVFAASTSQVVFSASSERKLQPGNITKLMTAMIVIDTVHSKKEYQNKLDITAEAAAKDPSLKQGKSMTVEALLDKMLTEGSSGAADLLVAYSASSPEIFVNEMNSKAISMRLMDTQFANATGEYSESQYSTCSDCAVIAQYALRYERIKEALSEAKNDVDFDDIYGGISGVLQQPELAIQYMSVAEQDGMELVVILLGADEARRQADVKALYEYGFAKVEKNVIVKANKKVGSAKVKGGAATRVAAYTANKGYAYIPPEGSESLVSTQIVMFDDIEAPLQAGSKVGEYRIYVADELKGTVDLITKKEVKEGWLPSEIYISNLATVAIVIVVLLLIIFVLRVMYVKKMRRKRRERERQRKIREMALKQLELEEDRRRRGWTNIGK